MLVEKPYQGEPPMEEFASHVLIGDAETVAERMTALIGAARPAHMLLHFQAGASPQKTALKSIDAFASKVRPMVEKAARAPGSARHRAAGLKGSDPSPLPYHGHACGGARGLTPTPAPCP